MSWHLRDKRTGTKKIQPTEPIETIKPIKPISPIRPIKPIAPIGKEYYWKSDK